MLQNENLPAHVHSVSWLREDAAGWEKRGGDSDTLWTTWVPAGSGGGINTMLVSISGNLNVVFSRRPVLSINPPDHGGDGRLLISQDGALLSQHYSRHDVTVRDTLPNGWNMTEHGAGTLRLYHEASDTSVIISHRTEHYTRVRVYHQGGSAITFVLHRQPLAVDATTVDETVEAQPAEPWTPDVPMPTVPTMANMRIDQMGRWRQGAQVSGGAWVQFTHPEHGNNLRLQVPSGSNGLYTQGGVWVYTRQSAGNMFRLDLSDPRNPITVEGNWSEVDNCAVAGREGATCFRNDDHNVHVKTLDGGGYEVQVWANGSNPTECITFTIGADHLMPTESVPVTDDDDGEVDTFSSPDTAPEDDWALLQRMLGEEAVNRGWCSEYEGFIRQFNAASQTHKLAGRQQEYTVSFTVRSTLQAGRNGEARSEANRLRDVLEGTLRNNGFPNLRASVLEVQQRDTMPD